MSEQEVEDAPERTLPQRAVGTGEVSVARTNAPLQTFSVGIAVVGTCTVRRRREKTQRHNAAKAHHHASPKDAAKHTRPRSFQLLPTNQLHGLHIAAVRTCATGVLRSFSEVVQPGKQKTRKNDTAQAMLYKEPVKDHSCRTVRRAVIRRQRGCTCENVTFTVSAITRVGHDGLEMVRLPAAAPKSPFARLQRSTVVIGNFTGNARLFFVQLQQPEVAFIHIPLRLGITTLLEIRCGGRERWQKLTDLCGACRLKPHALPSRGASASRSWSFSGWRRPSRGRYGRNRSTIC